jgi:Mrp family chromosome partitioning ATPase
MGKIFESLKRRDQAHDPVPERLAAFAASAGTKQASNGLSHPENHTVEMQIPFVEYPEEPREANPAAEPAPTKVIPEAQSKDEISFRALRPTAHRHLAIAPELVILRDPDSPLAEFYRQVGGSLHSLLHQEKVRSLLFVPMGSGIELKGAIANLALVLADKSEANVLLIDSTPSEHSITSLFRLASAPGWAELLTGVALSQLVQDTGSNKLHILGAGNRLVHARGELVQHRLHTLVENHGLVLLAGPPTPLPVMPALLAHACHATCLVLAKSEADPVLLQRSMDAFAEQRVRLLGAVTVETEG